MKTLTGGKRILDVFTLGDSGYFNRSTFLADVTKKPVIVNARTSVDITVDPKLRVITAVLCSDSSKKTEWKFSELHTGKTSI